MTSPWWFKYRLLFTVKDYYSEMKISNRAVVWPRTMHSTESVKHTTAMAKSGKMAGKMLQQRLQAKLMGLEWIWETVLLQTVYRFQTN
jgi:hypothetical protein